MLKQKVWETGGAMVITIPKAVCRLMDIEKNDVLHIDIVKVVKKK